MKIVILICDSFQQYREYMSNLVSRTSPWVSIKNNIGIFTIDDTKYLPLCHKEDIKKIMGLERKHIEIRIIGEKSILTYTTLKVHPHVFGLTI